MATGNGKLAGLVAALLVLAGSASAGYRAAEVVRIDAPQGEDLYLAGRDVTVRAQVRGDLVAAGQRLEVDGRIEGDLVAIGETVAARGTFADDVRAAGREIRLEGEVGGHVVAGGQRVLLMRESRVADWAWVAGERVEVDGAVRGGLKAAGERVVLTGEIGGDAEIFAGQIEVRDGATIGGDLIWSSPEPPEIAARARIAGRVIERPLPEDLDEGSPWVAALLFGVSLTLASVVYWQLFPDFSRATQIRVRGRPLASFGLGVAVLAGVPIVVVLLFVTLFGYLIALMLMPLYLLLLCGGLLSSVLIVANLPARAAAPPPRLGPRVLHVLLAVVALGLLTLIPLLGGVLLFLLFLLGLGALVLAAADRYRAPSGAAAGG